MRLLIYLTTCLLYLIVPTSTRAQSAARQRDVVDLSGHQWQMEGVLPGMGVKIGFHQISNDRTGDVFNWAAAQVPGDVFTDLWRTGQIEDPHYARNSVKVKWVNDKEWWYHRNFITPAGMLGRKIRLVFDGVDYGCDVYLNGKLLGSHEGTMSDFSFDVTNVVNKGATWRESNVLMVRLHPAPKRYSQVAGRKPAWHGDYWHVLVPTGIWKPVRLEASDDVRISAPYYETRKVGSQSLVNAQFTLDNQSGKDLTTPIQVSVKGKNFTSKPQVFTLKKVLKKGQTIVDIPLTIDDARLWYPWDLGEQNLYEATVSLPGDSQTTTFGIRQVVMKMNPGWTKEQVEHPWTVTINGKRHFLRSGTWGGPPDIFMGRATPDKYRELIRLAKEANFNNLRIFGWHPEEIPLFYELCNEAGITVWQDIVPLASLSLPRDEKFKQSVFQEAISVVKQQRNQPSLVMIEGAEELFMTASDPVYNLSFVNELGKAIAPYTNLHYLPGSPLSDDIGLKLGFKPNESEHANGLFYGEGRMNMETYFHSLDMAAIPELAVSSCPNVESIKKFIPENELWPPGPSWGHHWTDFDTFRTLNFEVLGDQATGSMESFVNATQVAQGEIFKFALEYYRRRKPKTSAICICHYITFAPDMKWGIVDYYQTKKASFDYVRKAYQPMLVTLDYQKRRWLPGETFNAKVWVVNDFYEAFPNTIAEVTFLNTDRKAIKTDKLAISQIKEDSSEPFGEISLPVPGKLGDKFYAQVTLKDKSGKVLSENDYMFLVADEKVDLPKLRAIGQEAIDKKNQFGPANYLRYFPGLSGQEGVRQADELLPRVPEFEPKK